MSYKELKVYQRSYKVSLDIHRLSVGFPKYEQYSLADQLRRASKSVSMNIAEGYGKNSSKQEFKRYLLIALGSCSETLVILDYCKDLGYISTAEHEIYTREYTEMSKMLYALHRNWRDMREESDNLRNG